MKDYQKYIRSSPIWKAKRAKVIKRARGICERCGKWPVVNVHHLSYENVGSEPLTDLLGVCTRCHQELHQRESA